MRESVKWNEREEVDWLNYTVQPPLGLLVGDYYRAENEFGAPTGMGGHHGLFEVVAQNGKLLFVEFNERAMEAYYNQYYSNIDKRRSDYGIWQASKPRLAPGGVVLVDGMAHVEAQMMARQSLEGNFELLTGASGSMRSLLPLAAQVAEQMKQPSNKRFYGLAEELGYGLTGWLKLIVEGGRIVDFRYDEVFADHMDAIAFPELKRYYKQSKYESPCFQEPFPPHWDRHNWNASFRALMDALGARVLQTQNLFDLSGLNYVEGANDGPMWDATAPFEGPFTNQPQYRYPAYDNYLRLAKKLSEALPEAFQ